MVAPVGDGGLGEGLIGVGGRGLELCAAHHDAGIAFLDDVQQHVRILLLRRLGTVALGIGVRGDVEGVSLEHQIDVLLDVLGEAGIDFRQHVPAVEERPHLADGFVAHPGDDPADRFANGVGGPALRPPVVLGAGRALPMALRSPFCSTVMMFRVAGSCCMS